MAFVKSNFGTSLDFVDISYFAGKGDIKGEPASELDPEDDPSTGFIAYNKFYWSKIFFKNLLRLIIASG